MQDRCAVTNLKSRGFEAFIYLAPLTVSDAVRDEHLILARQGLTFICSDPLGFG